MNQTTKDALPAWEATDRILMEDFNDMTEKVDAALKSHDDELAALEAAVAANDAAHAGFGNCQIYTTTYTGNGATSRTHTFPGVPQVVFVIGPYFQLMAIQGSTLTLSLLGNDYWDLNTVWNENSLTLSYAGTFAGGDEKMGNEQGSTYYMVALIQADI